MVGTRSYVGQPDAMSEALDSNLKFTESGNGNWYIASGESDQYYYEADSAQGTTTDSNEICLQAIVDSANSQTVKFYWKVSSEQRGPSTEFTLSAVEGLGTPAPVCTGASLPLRKQGLPSPKRTGCSAIT